MNRGRFASPSEVYFMLEFQSEVNRFMGLRSAVCAGMLTQDLVRARQFPSRAKQKPSYSRRC